MRPTEPLWHVLTNPLLLEFLCGTWLGYVAITTRRSQVLLAAGMVLLGLGCFALGIAWGYSRLPSVVMWGLPSALLLGGVVFLERNGWIPALIKRWSILGDSSYSLYLLHMLLMDIQIFIFLRLFEPGPITALAAAGCLSVVSIVVAAIAYRVLEQPLVSRLRNASRWSKGKPIADVS